MYRGRWAERDVAVKMMRGPAPAGPSGVASPSALSAADVLRSFRHEARLLPRLVHPNIVALRHAQVRGIKT